MKIHLEFIFENFEMNYLIFVLKVIIWKHRILSILLYMMTFK